MKGEKLRLRERGREYFFWEIFDWTTEQGIFLQWKGVYEVTCARITSPDVTFADALVLAASESSAADVVTGRAVSIAAFALALVALTILHKLTLILAVILSRVRAL